MAAICDSYILFSAGNDTIYFKSCTIFYFSANSIFTQRCKYALVEEGEKMDVFYDYNDILCGFFL